MKARQARGINNARIHRGSRDANTAADGWAIPDQQGRATGSREGLRAECLRVHTNVPRIALLSIMILQLA